MRGAAAPIAKTLLAWYRKHGRKLPWRENPDPYRVWVSEIMLQQTRVDTVIPYYHRFLTRFSTVAELADAHFDDVLKAWENLGYYARARNLHQAAQTIVERHEGRIPDTPEAIMAIPGIGRYAAGAILSIAFGKPVPAVDGNARRVLSRLFSVREPAGLPGTRKKIHDLAASLIPRRAPGSFNQALMDLGARICRPKSPACADCPLRRLCRARKEGIQEVIPLSDKKPAVPHERVVAAILRDRRGRILVVRRPPAGLLASLWKFPGGILKAGESLQGGLARTVFEETGIRIQAGDRIASFRHAYTHFRITLFAFRCTRKAGRRRNPSSREWHWATPDDLKRLAFSRADRAVMAAM